VCCGGLNLPHKSDKNKTLIVNPSGDEHQNPSDDDDDDDKHQEIRYLFSFGKSHMTIYLFVGLAYLLPRQGYIVLRFIIREYSSLRGFWPLLGGNNNNRSIFV
jgi:hypothetical protein